eukprot:366518-Chlamydomonas_euryale.AAC.5
MRGTLRGGFASPLSRARPRDCRALDCPPDQAAAPLHGRVPQLVSAQIPARQIRPPETLSGSVGTAIPAPAPAAASMAANRAAFVVQVGEPRPATSAKPSASAVYRHTLAKDGFPTIEASTLYELFARSVHKYGPNPCLGRRPIQDDGTAGPYTFKTYAEVGEQVADLGAGLKVLGVGAGKRVGVFGTNCPEWMTAMQASSMGWRMDGLASPRDTGTAWVCSISPATAII